MTTPPGAQRQPKPPTEAVFLRPWVCLELFLAAARLQNAGDSGDKSQELRIHAGLLGFRQWGQNGDV
jgi:hypothetical protein